MCPTLIAVIILMCVHPMVVLPMDIVSRGSMGNITIEGDGTIHESGRIFRFGSTLHGYCRLNEASLQSVNSSNLEITERTNRYGPRLTTSIVNASTVEFRVTSLEIEDWTLDCWVKTADGKRQTVARRQEFYVMREPLFPEDGDLLIADYEVMTASFYPSYQEQLAHTVRSGVTLTDVLPNVTIQWTQGHGAPLKPCSRIPAGTSTCVVDADDFSITLDGFYYFTYTVSNPLASRNKRIKLREWIKPSRVKDVVAKSLSPTTALVQWAAVSRPLRYNVTLTAQNFRHQVSVLVDRSDDNPKPDRAEVSGLYPAGRYLVDVRRIPYRDGEPFGEYSDGSFADLNMPEAVPAMNPVVLDAFESRSRSKSSSLWDAVIYLKPIEEIYRNGRIDVYWTLDVIPSDANDVTMRVHDVTRLKNANVTALKIERLTMGTEYMFSAWAENVELGRNTSLARTTLIVQKLDEASKPTVDATILPGQPGTTRITLDTTVATRVRVTYHGKMEPGRHYYVVQCPISREGICEGFPTSIPFNTTILLPPHIKSDTHRVGVFYRAKYRAARARRDVTMDRYDVSRVRRDVGDTSSPALASTISWSPCLYNEASVPEEPALTLEGCRAEPCFNVSIEETKCDSSGTKIEKIHVQLDGPEELRETIAVLPGQGTTLRTFTALPGHYSGSAWAESRGGLGKPVTVQVDVPSPPENHGIVYGVVPTAVVVFIALTLLAAAWCRQKRGESLNITPPEIDDDPGVYQPKHGLDNDVQLLEIRVDKVYPRAEPSDQQEIDVLADAELETEGHVGTEARRKGSGEPVYEQMRNTKPHTYDIMGDDVQVPYLLPPPPVKVDAAMLDQSLPSLLIPPPDEGGPQGGIPGSSGAPGIPDSSADSHGMAQAGFSSSTETNPLSSGGTASSEPSSAGSHSRPNAYPTQTLMPGHLEDNDTESQSAESSSDNSETHSESESNSGSESNSESESEDYSSKPSEYDLSSDPFADTSGSGPSFHGYEPSLRQ